MKKRLPITASLVPLMAALIAPVAHGETDIQDVQLDEQISQVLRDFPGGVRTAANEVTWNGGDVVLTIATSTSASQRAVGTCADGKFCAYGSSGLSGSKLTFSSCTASNSTAPIGRVRSFANARGSGTVYAYNGSTSVDSVGAGSWKNTSATITRLGC